MVVLQTRGNRNLHHDAFFQALPKMAHPGCYCSNQFVLWHRVRQARRKSQSLAIGGPKKRGAAAAAALGQQREEAVEGSRGRPVHSKSIPADSRKIKQTFHPFILHLLNPTTPAHHSIPEVTPSPAAPPPTQPHSIYCL